MRPGVLIVNISAIITSNLPNNSEFWEKRTALPSMSMRFRVKPSDPCVNTLVYTDIPDC